jgi:signal transduction histidine kinase
VISAKIPKTMSFLSKIFARAGSEPQRDYKKIFDILFDAAGDATLESDNYGVYLKRILDVLEAESGSLFLFHHESGSMTIHSSVGEKPLCSTLTATHELIARMKEKSEVFFKDVMARETDLSLKNAAMHYFTELLAVAAVPLIVKGQWVGILNVGRRSARPLDAGDAEVLLFVGRWLAGTIFNHVLYQRIFAQNRKLAGITEVKNQMMANVTHELRTPLNGILGLTELMLEEADGPLSDDQKRHLKMIESSGKSLLDIVNNILSLIKVEATKGEVQVRKVDLKRLVDEVSALFEGLLSTRGNALALNIAKDAAVYGNEDQLRTVFMNLIGNAVKYTEKGTVEIEAVRSGEMLKICVADSGIGIHPKDHEKIFEEFAQADGSFTRQYGGTGLGLAIVRRIVELHGGRAWVESQEGLGSRFYVTLPVRPVQIKG